jgi:hypothetical protein
MEVNFQPYVTSARPYRKRFQCPLGRRAGWPRAGVLNEAAVKIRRLYHYWDSNHGQTRSQSLYIN